MKRACSLDLVLILNQIEKPVLVWCQEKWKLIINFLKRNQSGAEDVKNVVWEYLVFISCSLVKW